MKVRIRLQAPMHGDHGHHKADAVVALPERIAAQVVANGHGAYVDARGRKIPAPIAEDLAPVVPPPDLDELADAEDLDEPAEAEALDEPAEARVEDAPTPPAPPRPAPARPGRKPKRLTKLAETPTDEATEAAVDLAEWDSEE